MQKENRLKARLNALISTPEGALPRPAKTAYNTLRQIVQWIPEGLVDRLAREEGTDIRKFTAFSHVLALLYEHLARATLSTTQSPPHHQDKTHQAAHRRQLWGIYTGWK